MPNLVLVQSRSGHAYKHYLLNGYDAAQNEADLISWMYVSEDSKFPLNNSQHLTAEEDGGRRIRLTVGATTPPKQPFSLHRTAFAVQSTRLR